MPIGRIFTVTIGKQNSLRQNITGGGKQTAFSTNSGRREIMTVTKKFFTTMRQKYLLTLLCSGPVVFLEEDHYVAEDFLPVLNLINDERMKKYPDCDIISMGTYLKSYSYSRDGKIVSQYGYLYVLF